MNKIYTKKDIDRILEFDCKRTFTKIPSIKCLKKGRATIEMGVYQSEGTYPVFADAQFYTAAPDMIEIIRQQQEAIEECAETILNIYAFTGNIRQWLSVMDDDLAEEIGQECENANNAAHNRLKALKPLRGDDDE